MDDEHNIATCLTIVDVVVGHCMRPVIDFAVALSRPSCGMMSGSIITYSCLHQRSIFNVTCTPRGEWVADEGFYCTSNQPEEFITKSYQGRKTEVTSDKKTGTKSNVPVIIIAVMFLLFVFSILIYKNRRRLRNHFSTIRYLRGEDTVYLTKVDEPEEATDREMQTLSLNKNLC